VPAQQKPGNGSSRFERNGLKKHWHFSPFLSNLEELRAPKSHSG
jgi:hypothetical protein